VGGYSIQEIVMKDGQLRGQDTKKEKKTNPTLITVKNTCCSHKS
jgi:hypothetical protein